MATLIKFCSHLRTSGICGAKSLTLSNQFTLKRFFALSGSSGGSREFRHLTGSHCRFMNITQTIIRKEGSALNTRTYASTGKTTGKKSKLLPFEQQRYVEKDTLLYERPTNTAWHYLGAVGAVMCGCLWVWAYNQWHYVDLTRRRKALGNVTYGNSAYDFITSDIFKYVSCSWLILFGAGVLGLSLLYPVRIVQKVILRSGGESLKIITYGNLKVSQQHLVKMENVSCTMTRQKANPYVRINVQGRRTGFLLDSQVGHFPAPELFDRAIGNVQGK